jgi:hypothetical protein
MPATQHQKHEAGRHLVVAQALLRGCDARIVGRSSLVEVNGRQAEVHVATKGAWQISNIDKFLGASTSRVVFVDLTGTVPEFFILEGDRARAVVKRHHDSYMERVGGIRPRNPKSKHAAVRRDHIQRWRNRWSLFD